MAQPSIDEGESHMPSRIRRLIFGAPKDVKDPDAFHKLSLIALLAWVGLGADGLSSSAYGPDEAFRQLGEHTGFAVLLALAMALTVFIISYGYSRIIEQFPSGGGGYLVASRLLAPKVGVISGAALLVDYVLTITISIASGADAIFSFLPAAWLPFKLPVAYAGVALLTAKHTMVLMAVSLAVTAAGILLSYLLVHAAPVEGKTMNAVLLERVAGEWTIGGVRVGGAFVVVALFSEGALLFVAAQAGFLDG